MWMLAKCRDPHPRPPEFPLRVLDSMTRSAAIARAAEHFDNGGFAAELARRVAIRTESQDPSRAGELERYLKHEIAPNLEALGCECRFVENPAGGWPFLIARRREPGNDLTVMSYGHGDVIRGLE